MPDPICGNGVIEGNEACDDGLANDDTAACKSDCTLQQCGDGFIGPNETCDDGNLDDADGCDNLCQATTNVMWEATYDSGPNQCDYFFGVDVAPNGRIAAVGAINWSDQALHDCDILVNVYEPDGTLAWSVIPATGQWCDEAWGAGWDAQGNLWVAGTTRLPAPNFRDQWVSVYDAGGNQQWTATFGSGYDDWGFGIEIDANGSGVLVGVAHLNPDPHANLRSIDAVGNEVWSAYFWQQEIRAQDVITFGDSIFTAGSVYMGFGQAYSSWIRRYNLQGQFQWNSFYPIDDATSSEFNYGIARAHDGSLVVAGERNWADPYEMWLSKTDVWLAKTDVDGNELWWSSWDNPLMEGDDRAQDLAVDSLGHIIAVGQTWDPGDMVDNFDTLIGRFDTDGNVISTVIENGGVDGDDSWYAIDMAEDDQFMVAGGMVFDPANCTDAVLRRYTP